MLELIDLIENYMIIKEKDRDLYYSIKDNVSSYKDFISNNLGYDLIIKDEFIKLEKIPSSPESWMGISDFTDKKEYIFFLNILMFLEDKNKEEQFILSNLTEYIESAYVDEKIDWTVFSNRKSLIKVMKFSLDLGLIKNNDGNEDDFSKSKAAEVLYESTGISRYMVRRFSKDLDEMENYEDLLNETFGELYNERGVMRKNRVYRKLLLSPIVYNNIEEDSDYEYIKNYRAPICNAFEKNLDWNLHVHRNGAMVALGGSSGVNDVFPSKNGDGVVTLFVNKEIRSLIEEKKLNVTIEDIVIISVDEFKDLIINTRNKYGDGFTKEFRDYSEEIIVSKIKKFMKNFSMIKEEKDKIILLPLIAKVIGEYPKDYRERKSNE
ncbi:TIGR02678 family protein [Clostridium gasigenes]|uniref:TIGR02678 family protein n=1 Tax=Clostridium gasigenes TaxID=94869 RepID=UPI0014382C4C|nr:TIGR02678 family protein [Clostridium gasigenes]NKF06096.1 TIGR02678 family protein [Clostridium gasigenes]QSW19183.1 TIGR02678 family protein [Clostridium gasigenes]